MDKNIFTQDETDRSTPTPFSFVLNYPLIHVSPERGHNEIPNS